MGEGACGEGLSQEHHERTERAERDSDGTRYEYIYGAGVPLELVVTDSGGASERYGYQVDAAGSVIGITDEAGVVIANYAYDPYGVPTATSGTDPIAARNPLRYTSGLTCNLKHSRAVQSRSQIAEC